MGCKIAGDRNEDASAFGGVAPPGELPYARLQHLIGVEACVFAQHGVRERGDQRLRRMAEHEMARRQPRREIDLSLPIERVQQRGADSLGVVRQVVEFSPSSPGMRAGGTLR